MKLLSVLLCVQAVSYSLATLPNLIDLIASTNNASTLLSLISQAGLTDTLRNQGPFTVLVPTDAAFAKIPQRDLDAIKADSQKLANVLQYHVSKGEVFTFDLRTAEHIKSLNQHTIRVYTSGTKHYFNQAMSLVDELQASNGVVYLIDEVLEVPEGNIIDILSNPDYHLSMFLDLMVSAHEATLFNYTSPRTGRYTFFVPSNAVLTKLSSTIAKLNSSRTLLRHFIDYHIHPGTIHADSLNKNGTISTNYFGHSIRITAPPNAPALLNQAATITLADIEAENGVVHVISHALLPSTLGSVVVG